MYKLFSRRKKEELGEIPDVYIYGKFPETFRNQFLYILDDVFLGHDGDEHIYVQGKCINLWEIISERFAREKGLRAIRGYYSHDVNNRTALFHYVSVSDDVDFLDLMEFICVAFLGDEEKMHILRLTEKALLAAEELNYRLRQHSLGYEFINGHLIEKINEQIHKEVIKPALNLLHNKTFQGAEEEYFQAFDYYKAGKNKDAILNAIKAFESVLKTICKEMQYAYDNEKDTAKQLLQHLTENGFYPSYLESHLTGIRITLGSGAPTLRNKKAGHGQGQEIVNVSDEYVEYALNLVATNIVLLVKIFNQKKGK